MLGTVAALVLGGASPAAISYCCQYPLFSHPAHPPVTRSSTDCSVVFYRNYWTVEGEELECASIGVVAAQGIMPTHFVIASVAWQSGRRSNGGWPTCSTSSRLPRRNAPRNDRLEWVGVAGQGIMPTHFVIASVAWQSGRRSNGGSPARVQPHRDCRVAMLLAMTD